MANNSIIHRDAIDFGLRRQWSYDRSSPIGGFNNTGMFVKQYTRQRHTSPSTQRYVRTRGAPSPRCAGVCTVGLEIYSSMGEDTGRGGRGDKRTLFPFFTPSLVSPYILFLFYYFFMEEKTISKPIKCLQPLTLILSILFLQNTYIMLEKVKEAHLKREGDIFGVCMCACI